MENLQVTSLEQLKQVKQTDIVNLGKFEDGTEFIAELKRPDVMTLAVEGKIPNTLLTEVTKLFNGKNKLASKVLENNGDAFIQLGQLMDILAKASLVNPTMKQLDEINVTLTQEMKTAIMMYFQSGVEGLKNFRKEQERIANNQSSAEIQ